MPTYRGEDWSETPGRHRMVIAADEWKHNEAPLAGPDGSLRTVADVMAWRRSRDLPCKA